MRSLALALACLGLFGCPAIHQTPGARAQEAANDLNVNARFGRMEIASEKVAPPAKDAFFERRRAWGGRIRVADYELAGMKMKGETDAEMFVKVAWYLVDEGDLHVTTLKQSWHDFKGDWKLTDEARTDGDAGLLGETVEKVAPPKTPRNTQFPTIRLGGGESGPPDTVDAPPGSTTNLTVGPSPSQGGKR